MDFQEKLKRLGSEVNKAKAARSVGLPPTIIPTYIAKGSIPRGDIALKMARALEVPVEWLLDDSQDWPPPEPKPDARKLNDRELMFEIARRDREERILLLENLDKIERVNWDEVQAALTPLRGDEPLPPVIARILPLVVAVFFLPRQSIRRFDPVLFAEENHAQMPGGGRPLSDFNYSKFAERYMKVFGNPVFQQAVDRLIPRLSSENRAEFERVAQRQTASYMDKLPQPDLANPRSSQATDSKALKRGPQSRR